MRKVFFRNRETPKIPYIIVFLNMAGLPATNVRGATSDVTTEPAAITAPAPIVTPGRMVE